MGETPDPRRQSFGAYQVERELGRGGMGVVYEAVHAVLGRRAAIKVLLSDVSRDVELVERFKNEARAASAIEHPSIVKVYDVGHDNDTVYIVMELLPGESLASRLKERGAMPIATAINFARQCAKALEAAHHANIVHRDLKPDNVFLVPDAEVAGGERVKLLDFGVAKLVEPGNASVARTVTGAILGTPHYMSPEQCEGAREVDQRSDLYSLGCMLFQMVTGRLPFQSSGVGGLIGMHLHVAPPTVASMRPEVPDELDALVARLLAKSPDDRPQTAAEVAQALVEINPSIRTSGRGPTAPPLTRTPVDAESPTVVSVYAPTTKATDVTVRRRSPRWLWLAIGGLVVAGAIVLVVASQREPDPDPIESRRGGYVFEDGPDARLAIDAPAPVVDAMTIDTMVVAVIDASVPTPNPIPAPPPKKQPPKPPPRQAPTEATVTDKQRALDARLAQQIEQWVVQMATVNNWPVVSAACSSLMNSPNGIQRINWERCVIATCKTYPDASLVISRAPSPMQVELRDLCDDNKPKPSRKRD